jgi:cell division septation protein DedD
MTYDISLDKKKAILLGVGCILIVVLSFLAGLFAGAMMQLSKTPTEPVKYEKPAKTVTKSPAVLAKKLTTKPKVKLPTKPRVKLPAIAKKSAPKAPAAVPVAPAVAASVPPPAPPTIKPQPYPYSIRVASFNQFKFVLKGLSKYRQKGMEPYFAKVNLGDKGVWWRLFTGYYPSRKAAQAAVTEHNLKGVQVIKTAYANLAGIFSSRNELNDIFKRLDSQGYSPYIIKDAENHLRLFTGAFITKKGAKDQYKELKADGNDCKVVER